ncbi:MAG TPA: RidA family protein [Acidobacteriaceae bacterium]|nr:RidA family protein [Acidobacteriaceae bacterium]
MRINIKGNSPFEDIIGFSRAVRCGNTILVSGTGPVGADDADAETQARHIMKIIDRSLVESAARMRNVVRTRIYLKDPADWEAVARVHHEYFHAIRPASTMLVVAGFLNPSWRVEIEVDAYL